MADPQVTIEQGTLHGCLGKDYNGNAFFKFKGIPYAKPPLGELRFKAPLPPEKWAGILDATQERDACCSANLQKNGEVSGSEDCLFLNVYTKRLPGGDSKYLSPVLFWIHGGGFMFGSGNEDQYGPDFLITEDVVVVTINYRLGLLGLINFDDPSLEIPGNAAFKDQVMALKWVQNNISKFGGDPHNVTIFGQSAGGVAVHLLTLSPMAKGLFQKAIAQSGCVLVPGLQGFNTSKVLAEVLGVENDDKTIYDILMEKSTEEIYSIQQKMKLNFHTGDVLGIAIEKNSDDPFLAEDLLKIIKSGTFTQVPFMIGYNNAEGMFSEMLRKPGQLDVLDYENYVPWFFGYERGSPEIKSVAEKIKTFYFGDEGYSEKTISKKIDMITDSFILFGIYLTVVNQYRVSKEPTYLYRMSVESDLNSFKKLLKVTLPGVAHSDDIGYLFKTDTTPEIQPRSKEDISLRRFVKLWTNFAKFGNPTPFFQMDFEKYRNDVLTKTVWKPVRDSNFDFLDIGEDLVPLTHPDPERIHFWKSLFALSPGGKKINHGIFVS